MKPVLTKIFKKGEYYQTYFLQLNVYFDFEKEEWSFSTFIKKNEKDDWIGCDCDFEKIKPYIHSFIDEYISYLKSCNIVKINKKAILCNFEIN
ncbi:MAG: hypothetical protein [Bacteriophage sp.]|jgi:hypothetical protein|uniref:Uncharacterized protein n=1 Tax=Myoviridae sp. ctNQV2 TaxID=2827683 RepID=A0A8S5RZB7_9CAUD|nr:MAG: hypothetical protein [Bacteriophage sp.]UWF82469.1 MAG: hypothetical protein [Bacteriophage sp.]UWG15414.1 MAG: hypothetical protein [Bacteriophage sp.]UWI34464.1 MAG: hypothetical protein [Bacteriophage sp.]DAF43911.1 MAG TPA: hypothetical protein [Myoviridae sp. ctNQV2]